MSSLIGKKAPHFETSAVIDGCKLVSKYSLNQFLGHYVVLFFYPLDFTFVCPTELHAFQARLDAFTKRGAKVLGCSIDSPYCHLAYLKTPQEKGGIQGVTYPLLSDMHKTIASDFGVLCEEEGIAYRGLFLIDKEGRVRHQLINDLPLGRSVEEALRMLDALIYFEKNGEVCPANWQVGHKGMKPSTEGLLEHFAGKH